MKFFLAASLFLFTIFFTACGNDDSPETATKEIQAALNQRDFEKFSARVDTEKLFAQIYQDATLELAANCEEFGKKYPKDPYFQRDGTFIKNYNEEHRELHLDFARKSMEAYFAKVPESENPHDNPYAYVAHEFERLHNVSAAQIDDVQIKNNSATVTVEVQGDSTLRGMFVGTLKFKLGFEKINDKWKLTKIENIDELTAPIVDRAELIWINL